MIKKLQFLLLLLTVFVLQSCTKDSVALVTTDYGTITIELLESTPLHRENFVKLVSEGYYDSLTFHRIEQSFVIQGGDPMSKEYPVNDSRLGMGGPDYKIDAEIGAPHLYGAVGMARDGNPEKRSSGSQFYIVTGRVYPEQQLNLMAETRNMSYSDEEKEIYTSKGGTPSLDGDYTVFGYVIEGMETVEKIQRAKAENPNLGKVYMNIKMIR